MHGAVLITCKARKQSIQPVHKAVIASEKSWKAMRAKDTASQAPRSDPWLESDPWSVKATPAERVTLPPAQLATLEANILKKVQERNKFDDFDMETETSDRVKKLEEQMQFLTDNIHPDRVRQLEGQVQHLSDNVQNISGALQSFQQRQQGQNTQLTAQLQAVSKQVEAQSSNIKTAIDNRLGEHMERIEALLSKRLKTAE